MRKKMWGLTLGGTLLLTLTAMGQSDSLMKFSLEQAKAYAIENSPSTRTTTIDIASAKKKIWETTAIGLPQVSSSASYQNIFEEKTFDMSESMAMFEPMLAAMGQTMQPSPPQVIMFKENVTADVTASQIIFNGEYIVGLQASKVFLGMSEQNHDKALMDIKESIASTYYTVLVFDENVKIVESNLVLIEKIYQEMKAMGSVGFMDASDVDQFEINKLNLQNILMNIKNQREVMMRLFKFQMGLELNQPIVLTDSLQGILQTGDYKLASKEEFNVENTIDYKLMDTQLKLSMLSARREKVKLLPSVTAFYKHQWQYKIPEFNIAFIPNMVGVSVSLPIFSSGMRMMRIQQANLDVKKAQIGKSQVEKGLVMKYEEAYASYNLALAKFNTMETSRELAKSVYNKTLIKYKEGVASSLDLTQAQSQYLTVEGNYLMAILEMFTAKEKKNRLLNTL